MQLHKHKVEYGHASSAAAKESASTEIKGKKSGERASESPLRKAAAAVLNSLEHRMQLLSKQHFSLLETVRELDSEAMHEVERLSELTLQERLQSFKQQKAAVVARLSEAPYGVSREFLDSVLRRQEQQLGALQQMLERKKEQIVTILKEKKDVARQMRANSQKQNELECSMLVRHERLIAE